MSSAPTGSREWASRSWRKRSAHRFSRYQESSWDIARDQVKSTCGWLAIPESIARADAILQSVLKNSIFSLAKEELEHVVVRMLTERRETIATAESCTGGLLAHRLTNVPGASKVFPGGFVVYANEMKANALGLDPALIKKHGAVSKAVAAAMAEAVRTRAEATYALATTGIAGPTGGSAKKPVGTVYIGLASNRGETLVRHFNFASDRETFKQMATQAALNLLREQLLARD